MTSQTTFAELGVGPQVVAALDRADIFHPFDIQISTIPDALAGRDVAGKAPTGSGKTLAFGIPMVELLQRAEPRHPVGLILAPTRELAKQISDALRLIAQPLRLRVHAFYGGDPFEGQIAALDRGVDIAVATPGRLLDLIEQELISLDQVSIAVVDEADRMADFGFLPDVLKILDQTADDRQTLLFSATLDGDVDVLVTAYQRDPVRHEVQPPELGPIAHHLWMVEEDDKPDLLNQVIEHCGPTVVFSRTRYGAERIVRRLNETGVQAIGLHGGNSQAKRERALADFRRGTVRALVATDVAARGIHVDEVACVVQYDLPDDPKDYVHRAGRTGRAGNVGTVISFVGPHFRRHARRILDETGTDADLVVADLGLVANAEELRAFDAALAALDEVRRPGALGGAAFRVPPTPATLTSSVPAPASAMARSMSETESPAAETGTESPVIETESTRADAAPADTTDTAAPDTAATAADTAPGEPADAEADSAATAD